MAAFSVQDDNHDIERLEKLSQKVDGNQEMLMKVMKEIKKVQQHVNIIS